MDTLDLTVVAPAAVEAPRPSWARPFASARTRASVVAVAFGILLGLLVLTAAANLYAISVKGSSRGNLAADQQVLVAMVQGIPAILVLLAELVVAVSFCVWMHRAYRNLPALGGAGLRYSPRQAVWAWFVPILNLFRPYQITREIWRVSGPAGRGWRLLQVWWALLLFAAFGGTLILRLSRGAGAAVIADDAIYAVTAIVALLVVVRITAWQERKATAPQASALDLSAAQIPLPGIAPGPPDGRRTTRRAPRYGLRNGSVVLAVLTLIVLATGLGAYAARTYEIAHWTPIADRRQDQAEHNLELYRQNQSALTSLQRKVTDTVVDLDHPTFTIWNACYGTVADGCALRPGNFYVGGVPDTFTYEINFRATAPVRTYVMTITDFVCWDTGDCRYRFAASWPAATTMDVVFHEAEGCADYLLVLEAVGSGTLYPNVRVVNNPADHPTGSCR